MPRQEVTMTTTDTRDLAELVTIARDIAQQMRAEMTREQRARLQAAYEDAHAAIDVALGFVV